MSRLTAAALILFVVSGCGNDGPGQGSLPEDGSPAQSSAANPATLAGGCAMLVGDDDLVRRALNFPRDPESASDERLRYEIQEALFSIVLAGHKKLSDPAGQLVDFLDDPEAYLEGDQPGTAITAAIAEIREACTTR